MICDAIAARFAILVCLAGLCACSPDAPIETRTSPLIGGELATEDPAVVGLMGRGDIPLCTGTLVSPMVVLTAAHCIDMLGAEPTISIFFGDDSTANDGRRVGVRKQQRNLNWTGDLAGQHDIGLLLLDFPQHEIEPLPLNRTAIDTMIGQDYRVVGFGWHDLNNPGSDGQKREGTTTVNGTDGDILLTGDDDISICFGDSGGPGYIAIEGVEYVAGVHSYTNGTECRTPNGDTRVDIFADDFIQPWIDANDTSCRLDWVCAKGGCSDDPDCQPCGPQGTCASGCVLPDPDCATSELGDICQADSQCISGMCAFWTGDAGTQFCTTACQGDDECPDGMSCQVTSQLGRVCYYDEAPAGVLGDACEQATDCGSYMCEQGRCIRPCDVPLGLVCPPRFACTALREVGGTEDGFVCWEQDDQEGGCRAVRPADGVLVGLLIFVICIVRRREQVV